MTVNITKNALNSQPGSNISQTGNSRETLAKLSSGVALPESDINSSDNSRSQDSSEVSTEAANKSISQETSLAQISSMQEEVNKLENVQTSLEEISNNLWSLEGLITDAREDSKNFIHEALNSQTEDIAEEAEAVDISVDTSVYEAEQDELQEVTDKYLEGIDHTGSELMDYLDKYLQEYSLDIKINTESLGQTSDSTSLASLSGDVDLSSDEASEIVSKAREEVAAFQISTETHRSNLLNDIGKEIADFTKSVERPEMEKGIEDSVKQISEMLMKNPDSIPDASHVNMSQAASLLLS